MSLLIFFYIYNAQVNLHKHIILLYTSHAQTYFLATLCVTQSTFILSMECNLKRERENTTCTNDYNIEHRTVYRVMWMECLAKIFSCNIKYKPFLCILPINCLVYSDVRYRIAVFGAFSGTR